MIINCTSLSCVTSNARIGFQDYFSEFFAADTDEELRRWLAELQHVTHAPISEINVKKEERKHVNTGEQPGGPPFCIPRTHSRDVI